jgi:anti-sigma-K factor RskA
MYRRQTATGDTVLSDEQLTAYIANTLNANERAQIEAALADEPESLRRLLAQETMELALRAHFYDATAAQAKQAVMADVLDVPQERLRQRVVTDTQRQPRTSKRFNASGWRNLVPTFSGWRAVPWATVAAVALIWGVIFLLTHDNTPAPRPQSPTVARLTDVSASVVVVRNGSETAAQNGFELRDGDTIRIGETSSATLVYPDATRLQFDANSQLRLTASGKTIYCEKANLAASVTKQPADRPLVLLTPQATVTVVGTMFSLWADADKTWLTVTEGAVRMNSVTEKKSVLVAAGQFAVAARDAELRPVPQQEITDLPAYEQGTPPRPFRPHGPPMIPPGLRRHGPPMIPPGLQKQRGDE